LVTLAQTMLCGSSGIVGCSYNRRRCADSQGYYQSIL